MVARSIRHLESGCHGLSEGFKRIMRKAGTDQELQMKLTGHASKEINRDYTHFEMEPLRAAVGKLPSLSAKA